MTLDSPVTIGAHRAPSRVVFGPHETNLGDGRALSDRHVAYYARRAAGGAGVIVVETASVTPNDWPYERAPLAASCVAGWRSIGQACQPFGTVVLAGIGHAGAQGSSAYSQEVMWAPSAVADVVSREPPAVLDRAGIDDLVGAFAAAARRAVESGLPGVEVDAGAYSLLRQFHSGLTNLRSDEFGTDRLLFSRLVLGAVRDAVGPSGVVALRLSCDELAPWAGVTPDQAAEMVAALAPMIDLLTVVRGGPYSVGAYRPEAHTEAGFNRDLCARMRAAAGGSRPVVLQGSVVDPAMAEAALSDGVCDLVEMTRAQIADADLLAGWSAGRRPRPCILCNQACKVRDPRNPIVSCVVDPGSGFELSSPSLVARTVPAGHGGAASVPVLVVGGGPAGLECARVLARAGRAVRLAEASDRLGGALAGAAVGWGRSTLSVACDWLAGEVHDAGVAVALGVRLSAADVRAARESGAAVVLATGGRPMTDRYAPSQLPVFDPLSVLGDPSVLPDGPVAVIDTVGDPVGVNLAEWLASSHGRSVTFICPDQVAGTQLARAGDLADANGRLQRAGVERQLRRLVRSIASDGVGVEDCWTGATAVVAANSVVDCGHRLPEDSLYVELNDLSILRIGDCVAPRSLLEAILEGRMAALRLIGSPVMAGASG
jgi:mycofactocin system FadH/OYE family oxidoreductase 1